MATPQWNAKAPSPPTYPETIQSSANMSGAIARNRIVHPAPVNIPPLGPKRCNIKCPFCNNQVITAISHTTTTRTHSCALRSLCCCCIPYCMNSTRNTDHYCTSCHAFLGTYEK